MHTGATSDGWEARRELSRSIGWSFDNDLLIILIVENRRIWLSVKLPAEAEAYGLGWLLTATVMYYAEGSPPPPQKTNQRAFEAYNR